jgi:hypothetical protein
MGYKDINSCDRHRLKEEEQQLLSVRSQFQYKPITMNVLGKYYKMPNVNRCSFDAANAYGAVRSRILAMC